MVHIFSSIITFHNSALSMTVHIHLKTTLKSNSSWTVNVKASITNKSKTAHAQNSHGLIKTTEHLVIRTLYRVMWDKLLRKGDGTEATFRHKEGSLPLNKHWKEKTRKTVPRSKSSDTPIKLAIKNKRTIKDLSTLKGRSKNGSLLFVWPNERPVTTASFWTSAPNWPYQVRRRERLHRALISPWESWSYPTNYWQTGQSQEGWQMDKRCLLMLKIGFSPNTCICCWIIRYMGWVGRFKPPFLQKTSKPIVDTLHDIAHNGRWYT